MNYYQAPPRKTTDTGTIILYLLMIFFGLPILLCCGGGLVLVLIGASTAGNGGGNLGGEEVTLENLRYQGCLAMRRRQEQELIAEMKILDDRFFPDLPPLHEIQRIQRMSEQHAVELNAAVAKARPLRGIPPPPDVIRQLNEHRAYDEYMAEIQQRRAAAKLTEQEQRLAAARAAQAERDQQREAQRLADQQAREQRLQELANNQPRFATPPPFTPPAPFNPPPPVQPSPPVQPPPPAQPAPQPPAADQPPPGFAVTALDQVKPKAEIFARGDDGWYPAVVTRRVGADVTVRLTTNGAVGRVTLDRIRLKDDPASAGANSGRPSALRPVTAQRDPANKPVPEDDALIVLKPGKDSEATAEQPVVAAPAGPPTKSGTPPIVRTWTNDTGEFKVAAELVGFEFDLVQLKKADGKVISIRIEKLSADDQVFVRARFP